MTWLKTITVCFCFLFFVVIKLFCVALRSGSYALWVSCDQKSYSHPRIQIIKKHVLWKLSIIIPIKISNAPAKCLVYIVPNFNYFDYKKKLSKEEKITEHFLKLNQILFKAFSLKKMKKVKVPCHIKITAFMHRAFPIRTYNSSS